LLAVDALHDPALAAQIADLPRGGERFELPLGSEDIFESIATRRVHAT
jgi:hypothetical protein